MRLLRYISYQLSWQLKRCRWLFPFGLLLFLSYRAFNYLTSPESYVNLSVNAWDLMFVVFGNPFYVYFAIGLLFIYLVSDLLPEGKLGQLMLIRLRSRSQWWYGKVITLFILTLIYVVGFASLTGVIAQVSLPGSAEYSEQAQAFPESVNLSIQFFRKIQPPKPFLMILEELSLLFLGLFSFGLLMLIANLLLKKYYYGLIITFGILLGSYLGGMISGQPGWSKLLPSAHFTYITTQPIRQVPYLLSIVYWLVWIILAVLSGFILSKRQNHYALSE